MKPMGFWPGGALMLLAIYSLVVAIVVLQANGVLP